MRKWINGGLISAKLGRGTPQGHRADGDRGQNTLCSPAAGVGDRERLGEAAGGAARTWVYSSPLGLHRPVYKVGGGSGVRTTAQKGEMHLAGLAQSSSGPQAGSCPPLRDQMAGQHPPAPWHCTLSSLLKGSPNTRTTVHLLHHHTDVKIILCSALFT